MPQEETTPIYARIDAFIRNEIASGGLTEGARLPSESELAERFDTTRSTVAKAMQRLVFEGLVVRRTGSGSFVASSSINAVMDVGRVRTFEEQLGKTDGDISYKLLTWGARASTRDEKEKLGLAGKVEVFQLERLRLVAGRVIGIEVRIIPEELGRRFTVEMMGSKSIYRILTEEFGIQVQRVEGQIRAGLASSLQASRLGVRRGAALLIREYTLLGEKRRPFIHGISLYRDDFRIDYVIQDAGTAIAKDNITSVSLP